MKLFIIDDVLELFVVDKITNRYAAQFFTSMVLFMQLIIYVQVAQVLTCTANMKYKVSVLFGICSFRVLKKSALIKIFF